MSQHRPAMKEILQKTMSVSRELDALQREHHRILSSSKIAEDSLSGNTTDSDIPARIEFEEKFKEEKCQTLNQSLNVVQKGMEEAQFMVMVANYISTLEGDKLKLKAQVKRLCAENNWLRESLTESQQLLQEAEVSLGKLRVEKEHVEFLKTQHEESRASMEYSPYDPEEQIAAKEGLPSASPIPSPTQPHHDFSRLDASADYEIPEKIRTLHQLALQHVNQGKPEVAIPLCRKAVQELEQKTGRNNPDLATLLNILAVIYREQGRFKEAIKVLRETLEIRENVFGSVHAAVASTLNNISVLYGKCGDFKIAEPFCQRALEIRQALLGSDHPDVAKQYCNLAVLSSNLGRYDEVEHYYLRALEIFTQELGPEDSNVTKTINNLANCYLKQGKYKAAEAMYKKILKTVHSEESGGGGGDRNTPPPHYRARTPERGQSPQGEAGFWHKLSPLQSPTLKDTLKSLTDTYRGQGRMEDAAELEKLSKEKHLDKVHRDKITRIVEDTTSSGNQLTNQMHNSSNQSQISTKKQGLPKNSSSKASLTWKWVVGQRTSQHNRLPDAPELNHLQRH